MLCSCAVESFITLGYNCRDVEVLPYVRDKISMCLRQVTFCRQRYVDDNIKSEAVVVFPKVPPAHATRFLVNFLLIKGSYITELGLFSCNSLVQAFGAAALLSSPTPTDEDNLRLTKQYIVDLGMFVPGSHL